MREYVRLTSICTPKQWKTISTKELKPEGYPVYGANGIIGYYEEYNHQNETVMITCRGATCGTVNISVPKAYITGNAMCLDSVDENKVQIKYLYYVLKAYDFTGVISGSAQPQITREGLQKVKIPLIELSEQKKIVELLDKIESSKEKRREQLIKLDDLVKSQFIEMFGDIVRNEREWPCESVEQVAPAVPYKGQIASSDGKFWLLNLDMVEAQTGEVISKVMVDPTEIGNSTTTFDRGNVLYSKLRPYLNKVVIPTESGYATSELLPLRPNPGKLNRYYFASALRSDAFVGYIQEQVAGAKMPRVSMGVFRAFRIPCPPMLLQEQFARFVEQTDKSKIPFETEVAA